MRRSPEDGWRYDQLAAVLARAGFTEVSSSGSHRTWVGASGVRITLKDDGQRGLLPVYVRATIAAIDKARDSGVT